MSGTCVTVAPSSAWVAVVVLVAACLYRWRRASPPGVLAGLASVLAALLVVVTLTADVLMLAATGKQLSTPVCTSIFLL